MRPGASAALALLLVLAPQAARAGQEPSPPALPAPPGPSEALLVLTTTPGVRVLVDGSEAGQSNAVRGVLRVRLAPGEHELRLEADGYQPRRLEIDIEPGETLRLRELLEPQRPVVGRREAIAAGAALLLGLAVVIWAWRRAMTTGATPPGPGSGPRRDGSPSQPSPWRATPRERTPASPAGETLPEAFGEYSLVERVGRGGMASVYRAIKLDDGEQVALKRPLSPLLDDPAFLERFARESEIGRVLNHPNVIRIFERGEVAGVPFFTMELLPGGTLRELLKQRGRLPPVEATQLVVQVAEALDYAHSKGVVHRDLKPSNVMVLPDGDVKVMDYGIARARRFEGLTVAGAFLGTPEYASPELVDGREIDARSDLYSLGVIFYEVVAGRRPFAGDNAFAVLKGHSSQAPEPPSVWEPALPDGLDELILRLLIKDPDARIASAEAVVVQLRDFLRD